MSFSYLSVQCFGIENIHQNVLNNFESNSGLSLLVKVTFLVIFLCSIPFDFFPLKICTLSFIEELRSQRISRQLRKVLSECDSYKKV